MNALSITYTKWGIWNVCLYTFASFATTLLTTTMDQLFAAAFLSLGSSPNFWVQKEQA